METAITAIIPKTQEDVWKFSLKLANGSFLPKSYTNSGKKGDALAFDVFSAIIMGYELGISPMMAIQSISIVNGTPALWGDVPLALVRSSNLLVPGTFKEYSTGSLESKDYVAFCESMRIGDKEPTITEFTYQDAIKANLIVKAGTWTTHPKRMFKYKARSFHLRDKYPDVLKGFHTAEELEGETINVSSSTVNAVQKETDFFSKKEMPKLASIEQDPQLPLIKKTIDKPTVQDFEDDIIQVFKNTIDSMGLYELESDTSKMLEEIKYKLGPNQYDDIRNYAKGALLEKRRAAKDE